MQVEQLDKLEELTGPAGSAGPEDGELAELMKKFYQASVQVCVLHVHLGDRKDSAKGTMSDFGHGSVFTLLFPMSLSSRGRKLFSNLSYRLFCPFA